MLRRCHVSTFRLAGTRVALTWAALLASPVLAGVAGTGTATVQVNFITQKLSVMATFANGARDLPAVNLGTLAPFSATGVSLSNPNVATGASFKVPFANATDSFRAVGDVACPAAGCTAINDTYAFVGILDMVDVSLLPADFFYTFDGSVACSGSSLSAVNCNGPFALNYFSPEPFEKGDRVVIPGTTSFYDPRLGIVRSFDTRVTLTDVPAADTLRVAGFSRERGAIPKPYVTSTDDGFESIFFDVATGAIFTNAEVCVVVDADLDGIVDGTRTPVSKLAGLHYVGNAFVLQDTRIDGQYACVTVTSLSPFALVAQPDTTTTTLPTTGSTTTTTPLTTLTTTTTATPGGPTTTTTLPCATARECLSELKSSVDCPGGLPASLGSFIDKKVGAAEAKLSQAVSKPTKAKKFTRVARTLLKAIDKKAAALAKKKKNGISAACRESVGQALAPTLGQIDAGSF
jgi:hypothetical protein